MAHYQVILAYDGTDFQGYQRQLNTRTVQGEVEKVLSRLGWCGETTLCGGRTDTGVHASGQVITFDMDWTQTDEKLRGALNHYLPADISVRQVKQAEPGFHPRYNAISREYCYRLTFDPVRNPLADRYQWRIHKPLQDEILPSLAALFIGRHDFAAYGTPPRPSSSTVRNITLSHWVISERQYQYHVCANAFLYHMVRRLVFVQVACANGSVDPNRLRDNIETGLPDHPGIAPPQGLELVKVTYREDTSGCAT